MPDDAPATAESLIDSLKEARLLDAPLEAAFRAVPRAAFLPNLTPDQAYKDEAVPVKIDEDGTVLSSSSQPSMMAIMLRQLDLKPEQNVLEIGTGTGYNAALMQHIVGDEGRVTSIEIDSVGRGHGAGEFAARRHERSPGGRGRRRLTATRRAPTTTASLRRRASGTCRAPGCAS